MKGLKFFIILVVALLAGAAGGIGSTHLLPWTTVQQKDVVVASEMRLVDSEGHVLALLGSKHGEASLTFHTKDDQVLMTLGVRPGGDLAVALHHKDGGVRALIGVSVEGAPFLELLDGQEKVMWSAP